MKYCISTILIFLFSLSAWADQTLKVFTLQHRFAEELIPLVSPAVGSEGTVTGINNQLIIRVDTARMSEITQLIQSLDQARVNRRITVASNQVRSGQTAGIDTNGRVIIGDRSRADINIDIENRRRRSNQSAQQFINVLDGERAYIRVGQLVPFTQEWLILTQRYARFARTTNWADVTTGFAVRPRTIGSQIELEITPRISQLNSRNFIDFNTLSTTVRVRLGEWVDIGGVMQNNDEVSQKILGYRNSTNSNNQSLKVKVD